MLNLSEEVFKVEFLKTMDKLAKENKTKKEVVYSHRHRTSPKDLTIIDVTSSSEYGCWLKLNKIFGENYTHNCYKFVLFLYQDESEENIKNLTMDDIIDEYMDYFRSTLFIQKS